MQKQSTHRKSFHFLSYALLAIMTLSIPLALIVSNQAQRLAQYAQTTTTTVTIETSGFSPATITIPAGTTVRWVNNDTVNAHTTTSNVQGGMDSWDSHGLGANQAFSQTFMTPGTYPYHCTLHPGMNGTVIVTASLATNTPIPSGAQQPTATPTNTPIPQPTGYLSPTTYCLGSCPNPTTNEASPSPTGTGISPTDMPSGTILSPTPTNTPTPALSGTEAPTATASPTTTPDGNGSNDLLSLLLKFILTFLGLLLSLFRLQ